MSFIETQSLTTLGAASIDFVASADLDVQKTLRGAAAVSFATAGSLEQLSFFEGAASLSLISSGFLRIDDEPNLFLEGSALISFSSALSVSVSRILQAQAGISLTARGNLRNALADRADALFQIQIAPVQSVSNYQKIRVRFSADSAEIPIRAFRLELPKNSIGQRLLLELANPVRNQFSSATSFKFEISLGADWITLLDTARLDSESFTSRFFDDRVSIDVSAPLVDRLALAPRKPVIYFDPEKTEVSVDERDDALRDVDGNEFEIQTRSVNNLTLYYLLNKAFVEGCGFSALVTNIPDYPLTRGDFAPDSSFKDSVSGFIGMFEPVFFEAGGTLYILDTSAVLPAGFTPRALTADRFPSFNSTAQKRSVSDGFIVNFADSEGDYYTQRQLPLRTETSGTFGTPDYTETDVLTTIREYRSLQNPAVVLRTEPQSEVRTTYNSSFTTIGEETLTRTFNSAGRINQIVKTIAARVPNLNNAGAPLFQTVREERVQLYYKPNPRNTREMLSDRIETRVAGLIAIDAENLYFGAPFEQDYMKAHEAGNLSEGMSQRFGAIQTTIETFQADGKGQTEVRRDVTNHLAGVRTDEQSDIRGGASAFSQFQTSRRVVVFRDGADPDAESGARLESFNAGELPVNTGIALARRKLVRQTAHNQSGTFDLIGADFSLRRGVALNIKDRWANSFGNFLIEALLIEGTGLGTGEAKISTQVTASEI